MDVSRWPNITPAPAWSTPTAGHSVDVPHHRPHLTFPTAGARPTAWLGLIADFVFELRFAFWAELVTSPPSNRPQTRRHSDGGSLAGARSGADRHRYCGIGVSECGSQ